MCSGESGSGDVLDDVAAVLVRRNREDARLALPCERHHTKIHSGFRVERQPDGRWRTWRPDGTEILLGPLIH